MIFSSLLVAAKIYNIIVIHQSQLDISVNKSVTQLQELECSAKCDLLIEKLFSELM